MPETGPSGSMSEMWKRSMVRIVRHRQPKGPATDRPNLTHRATSRLHHLDSTKWFDFSGYPTRRALRLIGEPDFGYLVVPCPSVKRMPHDSYLVKTMTG